MAVRGRRRKERTRGSHDLRPRQMPDRHRRDSPLLLQSGVDGPIIRRLDQLLLHWESSRDGGPRGVSYRSARDQPGLFESGHADVVIAYPASEASDPRRQGVRLDFRWWCNCCSQASGTSRGHLARRCHGPRRSAREVRRGPSSERGARAAGRHGPGRTCENAESLARRHFLAALARFLRRHGTLAGDGATARPRMPSDGGVPWVVR